MSGIAGIIRFDGGVVAPGLIESMTMAMDYRGPDGVHHWAVDGAALGHCMLHTTTESLEEQQPLVSDDGTLVLVMDGRVDNWAELRRDLISRGCVLRNRSDAELVMHAYQLWGPECLSRIDGDFALVIWHTRSHRIFCARDPMGSKPLNYHWDGKTLVFASDLHAILEMPEISQKLNDGVLAEFLAIEWCSRDETLWCGILRLLAAHYMVVDSSGVKTTKYWSPDLFAKLPCNSNEEYAEYYSEIFENTVKRMSRSHRPLSIEVSGGLDSSAIFALADSLRKRGELLAPDLRGYTMNFQGYPDADEISFCHAVAAKLGVKIEEVKPFLPPLSWYAESARRFQNFPCYPNYVMGFDLMREAVKGGSRVKFSGIGGDEWLGGSYSYYVEELAAKRYMLLFALLREEAGKSGLNRSLWQLFRTGVALSLPESAKSFVRGVRDRRALGFGNRSWLQPGLAKALEERMPRRFAPPEEKVRWAGQRNELALLADAENMIAHEFHERSAANLGLEVRRPFCTTEMVQFSISVPKRLLFAGGVNKSLHRQSMQELLPEVVLNRESKAEFSATLQHYLPEMSEVLIRDLPGRRAAWVDPKTVRRIVNDCMDDKNESKAGLYPLWVLFGCDALI